MKKKFILALVVPVLLLTGLVSASTVGASTQAQTESTPFSGPISYLGEVQSLPPPSGSTLPDLSPVIGDWQIQGLTVRVSADTTVRDNPEVGSIVRVRGTLLPDGVVAAELIAELQGKIEFTGLLQRMPADGYIGSWLIQGMDVRVTEDTRIKGDPSVWSFVKVTGRLDADGTVIARQIQAREGHPSRDIDNDQLRSPRLAPEVRPYNEDDDGGRVEVKKVRIQRETLERVKTLVERNR